MNLLAFKALNSQKWKLHYRSRPRYEVIQDNVYGRLESEWQTIHVNAKYLVDIRPIGGTEDYWPRDVSHVIHWVGDKYSLSCAMITEDVYKSIVEGVT
jgi:hypothetical protein